MRYRIALLLLASLFSLPAAALPKYFGYFANNTIPPDMSFQPENQDHTNVTVVYTGGDGIDWDPIILREVGLAKSYGNKAVVMVTSHLFTTGNPHGADPNAAANFGALVDKLVAAGYLVPGNPEASAVAAFYPVDEPEYQKGLVDIGGAPHPALANAVNVIKSNPATWNFPVAVVVSQHYDPVIQGMRLFDWAGMDDYKSCSFPTMFCPYSYAGTFAAFSAKLRPEQRTILVPQAATGGDLDEVEHDPYQTYEMAIADSRVIMLMPFLWAGNPASGMTGVRDTPALRSAYRPIGFQIKYGLYSQYLGASLDGAMVAGQYYNVVAWFRNISEKTWRAGTNISLGSQNPGDNMTWGLHRVPLPHDVGPGQDVGFNFTVRAPSASGTYKMQWQMVADGMSWFGAKTPDWSIAVVPPATGSISANRNPCTIPYGGSTCTTTLSWNSNRADAEVWASNLDGSSPVLFARAQNGSQSATWINTNGTRFTLKSGGAAITAINVSGVQTTQPPEEPPPHCSTPKCIEP
ncbi:NBR1-Ig-like domain-containing protein [Lysobacter auxotrophicus]|uniref:NBR1-Ig-like domain-containing protein n=1 Tax=Lysobacter auxotrophicus TaxID=2992573 RepID=A0ABM8DFU8_9GAMM|nr:NBR1-Ig-like domain-containing protein [Lysobacter auxotrophicus]BDU17472.1 NBR1-Ig-like domain-containing protein [Lysobacter auxotrophicus]